MVWFNFVWVDHSDVGKEGLEEWKIICVVTSKIFAPQGGIFTALTRIMVESWSFGIDYLVRCVKINILDTLEILGHLFTLLISIIDMFCIVPYARDVRGFIFLWNVTLSRKQSKGFFTHDPVGGNVVDSYTKIKKLLQVVSVLSISSDQELNHNL